MELILLCSYIFRVKIGIRFSNLDVFVHSEGRATVLGCFKVITKTSCFFSVCFFAGERCEPCLCPSCTSHCCAAEAMFCSQAYCYAREGLQAKAWAPHAAFHLSCGSTITQSRHGDPGGASKTRTLRAPRHQAYPQIRWTRRLHSWPVARRPGCKRWQTAQQWQSAGHQWPWFETWYTRERCSDHPGTWRKELFPKLNYTALWHFSVLTDTNISYFLTSFN